MEDTIYRQQAIEGMRKLQRWNVVRGYNKNEGFLYDDVMYLLDKLPSVQPEQTKMIKEIRKWINSENRGSADYFIVDKIEEIINKYE